MTIELPKEHTTASLDVFRAAGLSKTALPESWCLQFLTENGWTGPAHAAPVYPVVKGTWSVCRFEPLSTKAVRLLVVAQDKNPVGIHEIRLGKER